LEVNLDSEGAPEAADFEEIWRAAQYEYHSFGYGLRHHGWKLTFVVPESARERLTKLFRLEAHRATIGWTNFAGPGTPGEQVLYQINGSYVGRGEAGYKRILEHLNSMAEGTPVSWPRYYPEPDSGPRGDFGFYNKVAAVLAPVSPLSELAEWQEVFEKRKLRREDSPISVFHKTDAAPSRTNVYGWESGDRTGLTFAKFGRLVRRGEEPHRPAAMLSWTDFDPAADFPYPEDRARKSEADADYALNGNSQGKGFEGFLKALEELRKLKAGSVVHVRVCVRTQGPFYDPIIVRGQRHFQRTGCEPYFGMFPLLIEVAKEKGLQIEWIPDEAAEPKALDFEKDE
jgi:hypothetical protein